jgi:hypothetical protein
VDQPHPAPGPRHPAAPRRPHASAGRARTTSTLDQLSPLDREQALHPTDPWLDGRDSTGGWLLAETRAEQRWWTRQLAELHRDAVGAP